MGHYIKGKVYPKYRCVLCDHEYKPTEESLGGIDPEGAIELKVKPGDHVCVGCIIESIEEEFYAEDDLSQ